MKVLKKISSHKAKEKEVKELVEKIKSARTLMVVSIKTLPSRQFQEIKKFLRKDACIKVAKKNIMVRAVESLNKESILPLRDFIKENCGFAISNLEGFELARILLSKKTPIAAKVGQIAPKDIEIEEGPTSLVPGPAISELGALGIQISVEDGKIVIKKKKTVVKEGQPISSEVCAILQKLNIQPFLIGLEPIAVYDLKTEKIYSEIKIDPEGVKNELKNCSTKSLVLAQKIGYYCKETIKYFLAKASLEANTLSKKFIKED